MQEESKIWLEKYKPSRYIDLLSDEKTNRDILTWLKSWDSVVFGKTIKQPQTYYNNSNKLDNNKNPYVSHLTYTKYKYIIISGPPGIGKSTLASVIANHCNYNPMVVNASLERTAEKLINRIQDATLMNSISFNKNTITNNKPSCLILDEVDGIYFSESNDMKNTAQIILDLIRNGGNINKKPKGKGKKQKKETTDAIGSDSDDNNNNDNDEFVIDEDQENKKSFTQNKEMLRPIILICNDLYSKALIPLRKNALIFKLKKANPEKLFSRLIHINQLENLNLDKLSIKNICITSNYDIRVCLNSMQFFSYNKNNKLLKNDLASKDINKIGIKDDNENLFQIWNYLLNIKQEGSVIKSKKINELDLYYHKFNNKYDIINDGLFKNYLDIINQYDLRNNASVLKSINKTSEFISFNIKNPSIASLSGFYIRNILLNLNIVEHQIAFPVDINNLYSSVNNNHKMIKYFIENLCVPYSVKQFRLEILPFIIQLIQPQFRELSTEFLNDKEKDEINLCVSLINSMGIKINNNSVEDELEYDPDILSLEKYQVVENENILDSSNKNKTCSQRQYLIMQRELEMMNIKNSNNKDSFNNYENSMLEKKILDKVEKNNDFDDENNFIFRKKKIIDLDDSLNNNFIVKYNEGITNSVKRNLNISYFFS